MHLPEPTITFTIPSIQDDLPLECRIYHPACFSSQTSGWRKRAAIVAHPYAPLGGCCDDPVVDAMASTILNDGWVVGTFNFRGAGNSKGHTSWQSKPEQNDYISFIAFMVFYIHHLCVPYTESACPDTGLHELSPVPSQALPPPHQRDFGGMSPATASHSPSNRISSLLLAGYSYGALITTFLPSSLSSIIELFQSPAPLTPHASIRLRAVHLAQEQNTLLAIQHNALRAVQQQQIHNPKIRGSVRVGGDEDIRRASYDSHRGARNSFNLGDTPERVRKSIDRVRSITRDRVAAAHNRFPSSPIKSPKRQDSTGSVSSFASARENVSISASASASASSQSESVTDHTIPNGKTPSPLPPPVLNPTPTIPRLLQDLQESYLLVSPPINFLSTLIQFFTASHSRDAESHEKLVAGPTLALFGDDDSFVSVRRFRAWAEKFASSSSASSTSSSALSPSSPDRGAAGKGAGNAGGRRNGSGSASANGKAKGRSGFKYREVQGAGHFWHDRDAMSILREEVSAFVAGL